MEAELNYLVLEVRADHSYEMLMELIDKGLPSLCVTTTYPEKLERMFPPHGECSYRMGMLRRQR